VSAVSASLDDSRALLSALTAQCDVAALAAEVRELREENRSQHEAYGVELARLTEVLAEMACDMRRVLECVEPRRIR